MEEVATRKLLFQRREQVLKELHCGQVVVIQEPIKLCPNLEKGTTGY